MFMRYVHTEDDPVRAAAETVTVRRRGVVDAVQSQHQLLPAADREPMKVVGGRRARSAVGNYRPFRRRNGPNRAVPQPVGAIGPIVEESGFADRQNGTVIRSEADDAA
jgi:hypothetical protein